MFEQVALTPNALGANVGRTEVSNGGATTLLRYVDEVEGVRGYLALSGQTHRLSAGGLRVHAGVSETAVVRLAEAMTLKQRLLGLAVNGAKAGIDYDPRSSGKREVLRRFFGFLRPYLLDRLSLGPDMGTGWAEIEAIARESGIRSVKQAVATAQNLRQQDFLRRLRLLHAMVDGATLGERRAGHALGHATLGAIAAAGLGGRAVRIGIHGFGTLGRAAAMALGEAGITPTAVADEYTSLHCHAQDNAVMAELGDPGRLYELPLDVLVVASCEDAMSVEQAARLNVSAVVVGANLGLSTPVEELLHHRGILVVPDFVGGCGGSASMDALFGPPACPTPLEVLERVGSRMQALVATMFETSRAQSITPRHAALAMSQTDVPPGKPYGRWDAKHLAPASAPPPSEGRP